MSERDSHYEVLRTCAVCPGICQRSCPLLTATKLRASAPHALARAALAALDGDNGVRDALLLCVHCNHCVSSCPISNPLPEALRWARKRLGMAGSVEARPILLGGRGDPVVIASPERPPGGILRILAGSIYWLDTSLLVKAYWLGGDVRVHLPSGARVVVEDLDAPAEVFSGDVVYSAELFGEVPENAIVHIPCKAPEKLRARLESIARGGTLNTCLAAGGPLGATMPSYASRASTAILGGEHRLVVTPCAWAARALRADGVNAVTFLELATGVV